MVLVQRENKLSTIKRLVLDVLKPHEPSVIEVSKRLSALKGVDGVSCLLGEIDQETKNVKITIEGPNLVFSKIEKVIQDCGGAIHSIDGVYAGKKIVEAVETPQDR